MELLLLNFKSTTEKEIHLKVGLLTGFNNLRGPLQLCLYNGNPNCTICINEPTRLCTNMWHYLTTKQAFGQRKRKPTRMYQPSSLGTTKSYRRKNTSGGLI